MFARTKVFCTIVDEESLDFTMKQDFFLAKLDKSTQGKNNNNF
jgi:hypothetical protein